MRSSSRSSQLRSPSVCWPHRGSGKPTAMTTTRTRSGSGATSRTPTRQQTVGVPNLIADMNRNRLEFTVHNGDLKQGSGSLCDDALYTRSEGYFNSLRAPAMYTPGDNEWTDCDRPANGGFNSLERLTHIRQHDVRHAVLVRPAPRCARTVQTAPYVENRRWRVGRRHVRDAQHHRVEQQPRRRRPGPSRVCCQKRSVDRLDARGVRVRGVARTPTGLMLIIQANPGFDRDDPNRSPPRDPRTLTSDFVPPHPSAGTGYEQLLLRAPGRGDRLREAGRARARRLALLPGRQAAAGREREPHRVVHAPRDAGQQRAEREQRRPVGQGRRSRRTTRRSSPSSRRSSRPNLVAYAP